MAKAQVFLKSPTGLRAKTLNSTSFYLSWTASPTPGAMYNVLVWINMNGWVAVQGLQGISGTTATVTGLQPSSSYKAQIQAYLPGTKRTALSNTVSNINTQRTPRPSTRPTLTGNSGGYDSGAGGALYNDPTAYLIFSGGYDFEGEQ